LRRRASRPHPKPSAGFLQRHHGPPRIGERGDLIWAMFRGFYCHAHTATARGTPKPSLAQSCPGRRPIRTRTTRTWHGSGTGLERRWDGSGARLGRHGGTDQGPPCPAPDPRSVSRSDTTPYATCRFDPHMLLPTCSSWLAITVLPKRRTRTVAQSSKHTERTAP
jgi:hypothetical protein